MDWPFELEKLGQLLKDIFVYVVHDHNHIVIYVLDFDNCKIALIMSQTILFDCGYLILAGRN